MESSACARGSRFAVGWGGTVLRCVESADGLSGCLRRRARRVQLRRLNGVQDTVTGHRSLDPRYHHRELHRELHAGNPVQPSRTAASTPTDEADAA